MDVKYFHFIILFISIFWLQKEGNCQNINFSEFSDNTLFSVVNKKDKENIERLNPNSLLPPTLIEPTFFQNTGSVLFSWNVENKTPTDIKYIIRIYKNKGKKTPLEVIKSKRPIYKVEVGKTSFIFSDANKYLNVGESYIMTLEAKENSHFLNKGISDPLSFVYIPDCPIPINPKIKSFDDKVIHITWEEPENPEGNYHYILRYLEESELTHSSKWHEKRISNKTEYIISNLTEQTTYTIKLKRVCEEGKETLNSGWVYVGSVGLNGISSEYDDSCDLLESAAITNIGADFITVSWVGPPASPGINEIQYAIRYRETFPPDLAWTVIVLYTGNNFAVSGLAPNTEYEFEFQLVPPAEGICPWIDLGRVSTGNENPNGTTPTGNEEDPEITLPQFNCGDEFTPPNLGNTSPLSSAEVGDIFMVGGFPILLKEVSGGGGTFTGNGIVPLPFDDKVLKVEFQNISVNTDREVYSGEVRGINDNPANYPSIDPSVISIGGEICQVLPTEPGFDENGNWQPGNTPYGPTGFDKDGNYIKEPYDSIQIGSGSSGSGANIPYDPQYDPNGFDENGIHQGTGTAFNENGCSQLGLDENGQPCDPSGDCDYYWVQGCGNNPTPEGDAFAEELADDLEALIIQSLNEFLHKTNDSIMLHSGNCDAIRSNMESLLTTLGYERVFIFGPNDDFFVEGMNEKFITEPKPLGLNVERDPNEEALESDHIDLYHCDKFLYIFINLKEIVEGQLSQNDIDESKNELLGLISQFDSTQVNFYANNPDSLYIWVRDNMGGKVKSIYETLHGPLVDNNKTHDVRYIVGEGYVQPKKHYRFNKKNKNHFNKLNSQQILLPNSSQALAAIPGGKQADDLMKLALSQSFELNPEDVSFEFLQGWEYVGNVHRAFHLENIVKNRRLTTVGGGSGSLLPVVLSKEVFGIVYTIYLENIVFYPTYATLDAYFILEIPTSGNKLVFKTVGINFTPTGLVGGSSRLELVNDAEIRLNNASKLIVRGTPQTFVNWDCEGFAGMGIDAEIEFCREYLTPYDVETLEELPEPERVTAQFQVQMPAWGEFIADSISMDPFAITEASDIKWNVQNMVLDFAESTTPSTVKPPPNYNSQFAAGSNLSPLWKGFYLQELSATFPRKLTGANIEEDPTDCSGNNVTGDQTVTISVNDVIIDDMGFTGLIAVTSILDLNTGNLSGWSFSIDSLKIGIVANRLAGAGFSGLVHVPILSNSESNSSCVTPEDCLRYSATMMSGNKYNFAVFPGSDYKVKLWKAKAVIDKSSSISINYIDGDFIATANLNGKLKFDEGDGQGLDLNIEDISFQNVQVLNKAPYFKAGTWGLPGSVGAKFAGFGITVEGMDINTLPNDEVALDWITVLRLTGDENTEDSNKLTAAGRFSIVGYLDQSNARQKWKFKEFKVNEISVDGSFPGVKRVAGLLTFYDEDPVYGKGFRGIVKAAFAGMGDGSVEIDAMAMFGKISSPEYKYFMIDAMASFDPGLPMGALKIMGFGGGVYKHMERENVTYVDLPQDPPPPPTIPPLGSSLSGIMYTPNKDIGMGFKATVLMATQTEAVFNANATFEMTFNGGGGLKNICFRGNARFLDPPQNGNPPTFGTGKPDNGAAVNAYIDINYNFNQKILDANLEVYMNFLDVIKGADTNDRFVQAALYFGPDKWYIYMGKPDKRAGLKIDVPLVGDLLEINSYLMVGNDIPAMPQLPPEVAELTGAGNFMANESMRASGNGFAFGANLNISTGDLQFLVFYANFDMGIGFDMMLQDYGDAVCAHSGESIGINGWYASGQAWAYVQGDIGIKVKVFGNEKKYEILSIAAGAVLQAKLPNPFWAQGSVGGRYSVLGGLVKGDCKFQITIGESCQISGANDPLEELDVILDVKPFNESTVEVHNTPEVTFNLPVFEDLSMTDINGVEHNFYAGINYARLIGSNGSEIYGKYVWNEDKTFLAYEPYDMLPANDSITFEIEVFINDNGQLVNTEYRSVTFFTGGAMNIIPETNVVSSYPFTGMYNFYKEEWSQQKGFIELAVGQPNLFFDIPEGFDLVLQISHKNQVKFSVTPEYLAADRVVTFPLPPGLLENEKVYKYKLVYTPTSMAGMNNLVGSEGFSETSAIGNMLGNGVSNNNSNTSPTGNNVGASPSVSNQSVGGGVTPPPSGNAPHTIYESYFRVSKYNTFATKLDAFHASASANPTPFIGGSLLIKSPMDEPFDEIEIGEDETISGLIECEAIVSNNSWINNKIKPDLYSKFPGYISGTGLNFQANILNRDPSLLGKPIPQKAVTFMSPSTPAELVYGHTAIGEIPNTTTQDFSLLYDVPRFVKGDWDDFKLQLENRIAFSIVEDIDNSGGVTMNGIPQWAIDFLEEDMPLPTNGMYKVEFTYRLPGSQFSHKTFRTKAFVKN